MRETESLFTKNCKRTCFILILVFMMAENSVAQIILFKKDGSQIEASHITKQGNTYSYNTKEDITHFISISALDSIRFYDGRVERYISNTDFAEEQPGLDIKGNEKTNRNSVGINIWPIFSGSLEVFYERFIYKDKLGFKNYFLTNTSSDFIPYGSFYKRANYYFCTGLNYYFLQSYFHRLGTGLSFLTGQFDERKWNEQNYADFVDEKISHSGMYLNASYSYKFEKNTLIFVELDLPLTGDELYNQVLFKTEIAINF